ncbi:hypothetical protein ASG42_25835 [Rhizobium sp. Leaf391]|uniref:hypothetical protein n=1 Tax=Rhizobium sp. Leaf391 TaxID=1736360 RepID=UPI0007149807|nr:hypothetical protein [Rhizobium sp. Leaf391]KQT02902.1 hypothetical protein ASG42_25835 [Rhizobium sp. Leaf391]
MRNNLRNLAIVIPIAFSLNFANILRASAEISNMEVILQDLSKLDEGDHAKIESLFHQLEVLADAGNARALQILGDLYSKPGPVATDGEKALSYYEKTRNGCRR